MTPRRPGQKKKTGEDTPYVDTELFSRTFKVGLKTLVSHLRANVSDYWGFTDEHTILYIIEEDGTLRHLQYDNTSSVTKIVEQYHTQAQKHYSEMRFKRRKPVPYEKRFYSCFNEHNGDYKAVFYLARAKMPDKAPAADGNSPTVATATATETVGIGAEQVLESDFP